MTRQQEARKQAACIILGLFMMLNCCCILIESANPNSMYSAQSIHDSAQADAHSRGVAPLQSSVLPPRRPPPSGKRAVFYSEHKLRSVVQTANYDLRQLKRDFLAQMTDIYLASKMDETLGFNQAQQRNSETAISNMLLAAEFADLAVKKFTIERRLLTGLKSAFVKFMPMETLVRLYKRYDSFSWLRYQSQCDLRQRLPPQEAAKDEHVEIIYGLIEARARVRAADDVIALTADNMQRILQTFQWFLVESKHSQEVRGDELKSLAEQAQRMLNFYIDHVVDWAAKLRKEYAEARQLARPLYEQFGGKRKFLNFLDEIINVEVLDIDLNEEANELDLPPTINKQMIQNLSNKWIPSYVLKSLEEDRRLVMDKRNLVMHLVRLHPDKQDANLGVWSANVLSYVCRNQVVYY